MKYPSSAFAEFLCQQLPVYDREFLKDIRPPTTELLGYYTNRPSWTSIVWEAMKKMHEPQGMRPVRHGCVIANPMERAYQIALGKARIEALKPTFSPYFDSNNIANRFKYVEPDLTKPWTPDSPVQDEESAVESGHHE